MQTEVAGEQPASEQAQQEVETRFSVKRAPRGNRGAYQVPRLTLGEAAEALPRQGNHSK
jgi:hypothetical protein